MPGEFTNKYCIIGAGSSGLVAAKNLKEDNIPFDVIERSNEVGGTWNYENPNSSIYRSTHLISSKPLTEYTDFAFPEDCPDYPSHRLAFGYFKAYTEKFDLRKHIEFSTSVEQVERDDGGWRVTLSTEERRLYNGLIIANGHLWDPRYPDYAGSFRGRILHSKDYKTPDVLKNKNVLVVGAGNSGCDIAVESAQNATQTFHSVRRGYHYIPKYLFGKPADQVGEASLKMRVPLFLRRAINTALLKLIYGRPEDFGLAKPDHKLFESHPIINSQIYYYLGHGDIIPKPDIAELHGQQVFFKDGTAAAIDLIIYATGYKISFPFIEKKYLNWQKNHPELFLNIFHPKYDNLFVAGLIQPDSGQWGLVDYQTQLIAKFLAASRTGDKAATKFCEMKSNVNTWKNGRIRYLDSSRHDIEVEHFSYRRQLQRYIRMLS